MVWPDGGLDSLLKRGAIGLACNLALMGFVGESQEKLGVGPDEAKKLIFDSLVPTIIVQPSGIFAVTRAQEAGCNYIRAT